MSARFDRGFFSTFPPPKQKDPRSWFHTLVFVCRFCCCNLSRRESCACVFRDHQRTRLTYMCYMGRWGLKRLSSISGRKGDSPDLKPARIRHATHAVSSLPPLIYEPPRPALISKHSSGRSLRHLLGLCSLAVLLGYHFLMCAKLIVLIMCSFKGCSLQNLGDFMGGLCTVLAQLPWPSTPARKVHPPNVSGQIGVLIFRPLALLLSMLFISTSRAEMPSMVGHHDLSLSRGLCPTDVMEIQTVFMDLEVCAWFCPILLQFLINLITTPSILNAHLDLECHGTEEWKRIKWISLTQSFSCVTTLGGSICAVSLLTTQQSHMQPLAIVVTTPPVVSSMLPSTLSSVLLSLNIPFHHLAQLLNSLVVQLQLLYPNPCNSNLASIPTHTPNHSLTTSAGRIEVLVRDFPPCHQVEKIPYHHLPKPIFHQHSCYGYVTLTIEETEGRYWGIERADLPGPRAQSMCSPGGGRVSPCTGTITHVLKDSFRQKLLSCHPSSCRKLKNHEMKEVIKKFLPWRSSLKNHQGKSSKLTFDLTTLFSTAEDVALWRSDQVYMNPEFLLMKRMSSELHGLFYLLVDDLPLTDPNNNNNNNDS
ncbi:hypothetical protein VP01_124g1 [Puccinia sorghi]|uniref:Uncharacterized protein n=1 Tax=Puccinia sorghi TaxID=27349 RepID=A0A0L6VPF5_9BASI|nr:hypothetical protein VP01_124g1 [Puccinia sorghi]